MLTKSSAMPFYPSTRTNDNMSPSNRVVDASQRTLNEQSSPPDLGTWS